MKAQQIAVTRVEVIDPAGRIFVGYFHRPGVVVRLVDGGRTMKLFATDVAKMTTKRSR